MKLSEIKINQSFTETTPKEEKLEKFRRYYNTHKRQDRNQLGYVVMWIELID